jgi:malonyl-CoA O-methyltransferase
MNEASVPDKRQMRRSFEKAASTYDDAAVLQREVSTRALERLYLVRINPAAIVDAGCGTGFTLPPLRKRYPRAVLVALDIAFDMLQKSRQRIPKWKQWTGASKAAFVCGDIESLPLRAACADMLWSMLSFHWAKDLAAVFAECRRILKPGGLLMFTTFGPDTLKELRSAWAIDSNIHVNRFIDMHDIGDMMVAAGFSDPVMDMEYLTLTYDDIYGLMHELKAVGAHNVAMGRNRGLTGKRILKHIEQRYESLRQAGRLPATFEVIYGHAWKPTPRVSPAGRQVIDIKPA